MGRYDEAAEHLKRSLSVSLETGDEAAAARALNNLGLVHQDRADYGRAMDFLTRVVRLDERLGKHGEAGYALGNLATLNLMLGDDAAAALYYERAFSTFSQAGEKAMALRALMGKADALREGGDPRDAEAVLRGGIENAARLGDKALMASLHLSLAKTLLVRGSPPEAHEELQKALALETHMRDSYERVSMRLLLAEASAALGDHEAALVHARAGLNAARLLDAPELVWSAHETLAGSEDVRGRAHAAQKHLQEAVAVIEGVRGALKTEQRSGFLGVRLSPYQSLVELLLRQGAGPEPRPAAASPDGERESRAFQVTEKMKARGFLDQIALVQLQRAGLSRELGERWAAIEARMHWLRLKAAESANSPLP